MAKDPAFLFYPGDFMGGTMAMTRHQKGCYIDLLIAQFNLGPLSLEAIKTVLGPDQAMWTVLSTKFKQTAEGLYFNQRLATEIEKRKAYTESRRNNLKGKKNDDEAHMQTHMGDHKPPLMENRNENEITDQNSVDVPESKSPPKKTRQVFVPPTVPDIEAELVHLKGNPQMKGYWPPDKIKFEALKFFNHYDSNGWKQGKGKPIVKWKAALNGWILRNIEGAFSPGTASTVEPAAVRIAPPPVPTLTKEENEINFLYGRFLEGQLTHVSIYTQNYDFLKKTKNVSYSGTEKLALEVEALSFLEKNNLEVTHENKISAMKKFGVLRYFSERQAAGDSTIFELENLVHA